MFSGPPGNLFSILTNAVFISSFVYLCYNICIFSHCVYKKSAKIINFEKTQKRSDWDRVFWVTPPPPPPPSDVEIFMSVYVREWRDV